MKLLRILFSFFLSASSLPFYSSPANAQASPETLSLENYALPKSLGKIEERFKGSTDRWVIQIQDIHAHFPAQENISAIIDHLNAVYGIKAIGIEGGWTDTSFSESWGLPSSREKQMLARALMEQHHITGPAYAALFSPTPLHLIGVEDKDLYKQNRAAFLSYLNSQPHIVSALENAENNLKTAKSEVFGSELKSFDQALTAFRDGHKGETFLPLVIQEAAARDVSLEDFPQIALFARMIKMEASLDKEKLEAEAGRLMKEFKRERLSFEELLKSGIVPAEKLQHYPASRAYLDLLKLQDSISYRDFFSELDAAVLRIKEKLYRNEEERTLDERWGRFLIAKQIISLKATPSDLEKFSENEEAFRSEMIEGNLEEVLSGALEFYRLAKERDEVFFKAMMGHPELSSQNAVLVAGGFHTDAISKKLKAEGVSYIVITPELQGEAPDEKAYYERMKDPVPESQTLAAPALYLTEEFDVRFVDGVRTVQTTKNIFAAVEIVVDFSTIAAEPSAVEEEWDIDAWKAMSDGDKQEWIRSQWQAREKNQRMYLAVEGPVLAKMLKEDPGSADDDIARALWEHIHSDRNTTLLLVVENPADTPMEVLGGRLQVKRVQESSLADAFPGILSRYPASDQESMAVIVPQGTLLEAERILKLPEEDPILAFLFRAILSNPQLRLAANSPEFRNELRRVLLQIENMEAFLSAA